MKVCIEHYAKLNNTTYDDVLNKMQEDKNVQKSIMMLMFSLV